MNFDQIANPKRQQKADPGQMGANGNIWAIVFIPAQAGIHPSNHIEITRG